MTRPHPVEGRPKGSSDDPCLVCGARPGEKCKWKPGQVPGVMVNGVVHDFIHLGRTYPEMVVPK